MKDNIKVTEALQKKAAFGADINLDSYDDNDSVRTKTVEDLSAGGKAKLQNVGIELDEANRVGTFVQVDNAPVKVDVKQDTPLVLMNTGAAAKKYPELVEKYWWKAVAPDADKFTAKTALEAENGYFVHVAAGKKISAPLQACVFVGHEE
ncbi:MAG: hypothetical protein PHQ45_03635 [Acidaminococcaceae bacterium]|nr:hypothetical protein [Acidaminococcaceae bacterium]